ncbi:MAG: hypothetical protein AB1758_00800 [Candidatus Eremiobacterota bacterium]
MHRSRLVEGLLVLVAATVLAAILVPRLVRERAQRIPCKSLMKNIGTALEMYATDFGGHYPNSLSLLTPNYLKVLPECPNAGTDTYSAGYRVHSQPDRYTFCCLGLNHKGQGITAPNYPQYTSTQGLVERP